MAMVTENFWQKRMGGDANVIGRSITLDGVPHTIVGVLPNLPFSWTGPNTEIWTTKPYVVPGISYERVMRGSGFLRVIGRLKPGMTIDQARAAMPPLEQIALPRIRIHVHHASRVFERQTAQKKIVDQTEDRGVQADAESERKHR